MARVLNNVSFILNDDGTVDMVVGHNRHVNVLTDELAKSIVRDAIATDDSPGVMQPDGLTCIVDENGILRCIGGGSEGGTPVEAVTKIQGVL